MPGAAPAGSHDVHVILLHRDSVGGSIGITLAGGSDYESKEITVSTVNRMPINTSCLSFSRCIRCWPEARRIATDASKKATEFCQSMGKA